MSTALQKLTRLQHGVLPPAAAEGAASFYTLPHTSSMVCDGTACHFAGGPLLSPEQPRVRCLGHCFEAPARLDQGQVVGSGASCQLFSMTDPPIVLRHLLAGTDEGGELPDGEQILAVLKETRLRGRGGAAFPTAAKWQAAREAPEKKNG